MARFSDRLKNDLLGLNGATSDSFEVQDGIGYLRFDAVRIEAVDEQPGVTFLFRGEPMVWLRADECANMDARMRLDLT
jgi:hypothetical protein